MTMIVKAANAAQFLSVVPRMLGFLPQRSVVLVPFDGARSLGAMRFDLPPAQEDPARLAATHLGIVCRVPHADALAIVIYGDEEWDAAAIPRRALADALLARADDCGLRVTDALFVGADAWGSYLDAECPARGRPLAELETVPAGTGGALPPLPTGDQTSGADLPVADAAAAERVAEALRSLGDAVELLCGADAATTPGASRRGATDRAAALDGTAEAEPPLAASTDPDSRRIDPAALVAVCALDDLPTLFEDALEWDAAALAPYDAAALIWCLARPSLRDIALVQWCSDIDGGDEALTAQLRWEAGEEYPAHLAMHMWGEGEQPEPARLDAALDLARAAASLAPERARAGALATCAWLSWALGRSTHAERYAQQACGIEPEHGLAEIVLSFIGAGHLPDWAFHRRSAARRPESHRIL